MHVKCKVLFLILHIQTNEGAEKVFGIRILFGLLTAFKIGFIGRGKLVQLIIISPKQL